MTLTPREQEVVVLRNSGLTLAECANRCGVSVPTVWKHVQAAKRKGVAIRAPQCFRSAMPAGLSQRERECLDGLLLGAPLKATAQRLGISISRVAFLIGRMRQRAGVDTNAQLAVWYDRRIRSTDGNGE